MKGVHYYDFMENMIKVKKLVPEATLPTKGSEYSAGWDLYAVGEYEIAPGDMVMIRTGLAFAIPFNHFGAVYPRSGCATKQGLRLANCVGVIDSDYRGEVKVPLYNDSDEIQYIYDGNRIAQMIIQSYNNAMLAEADDLDETERGNEGFGSTGK